MKATHRQLECLRWWLALSCCFALLAPAAFGTELSSQVARAQAFISNGNETAALRELQGVLEAEPNNLFALGNAGLICARQGELSLSARYLARAHRLKPNDPQLGLALLEVYARSGRRQDAESVSADLRAGGQLSSPQIRGAALLLVRLGSLESAAAVASSDPVDSASRHDLLGSIYASMDDVQKASDEMQASIRLDPENDRSYFQLGMLYLKYRTPALAVLVFEHGIERKPDSALLWLGLGVSQSLDEKLEPGEQSLKKAIELNPRMTDAYLLLGDILEQEKPREALEIFRRTMKEHPELAVAYYYYGRLALLLNEGSSDNIIEVLRRAVTLNPDFAESHYELGRALEQRGKTNEAIVQFEASLRLNPRLFRAHYRLAMLYRQRGDSVKADVAMKTFQQAQKSEDPELEIKRLEYEIKQR